MAALKIWLSSSFWMSMCLEKFALQGMEQSIAETRFTIVRIEVQLESSYFRIRRTSPLSEQIRIRYQPVNPVHPVHLFYFFRMQRFWKRQAWANLCCDLFWSMATNNFYRFLNILTNGWENRCFVSVWCIIKANKTSKWMLKINWIQTSIHFVQPWWLGL